MNYFSSEDLDCVCFIEEKTNNVVIKFFGMPNAEEKNIIEFNLAKTDRNKAIDALAKKKARCFNTTILLKPR